VLLKKKRNITIVLLYPVFSATFNIVSPQTVVTYSFFLTYDIDYMQKDRVDNVQIVGFTTNFLKLEAQKDKEFYFPAILLFRKSGPGVRKPYREANVASLGCASMLEWLQEIPRQMWAASEWPIPSECCYRS
jgi:hypothetical protein